MLAANLSKRIGKTSLETPQRKCGSSNQKPLVSNGFCFPFFWRATILAQTMDLVSLPFCISSKQVSVMCAASWTLFSDKFDMFRDLVVLMLSSRMASKWSFLSPLWACSNNGTRNHHFPASLQLQPTIY